MSTNNPKPCVLLVEDEPANALIAAAICERAGCEVTLAPNGHRALALFDAQAFDLVLMDVQMPGMDGLALARALRAHPRGGALPLIAVTARAAHSEHVEMRTAGIDAIVTKPYHNRELRAAIAAALGW